MEFTALCSGSSANCLYIRAGKTRVLVDAGCSCRYLERALATLAVDPAQIAAILITHEHTDHINGAARISRRYGIPIFASELTWQSFPFHDDYLTWERNPFRYEMEIGELGVRFFKLSHDAVQPVGMVFEARAGQAVQRLGVVTDTGCVTPGMHKALQGLDALILEANHSVDMLKQCRYPAYLKRRIVSEQGHLSNFQAAELLAQVGDRLQAVLLAHLSLNSNSPQLALREVAARLAELGYILPCEPAVALRNEASPLIALA